MMYKIIFSHKERFRLYSAKRVLVISLLVSVCVYVCPWGWLWVMFFVPPVTGLLRFPGDDDGKVQELLKTTTYQRLLDCFVFLFCGWVWVGGGGCFRVWISVIKLWFSSGMTGSCGSARFGSDAATCSWCCWGELLLLNDVCLRTWPGDGWRGRWMWAAVGSMELEACLNLWLFIPGTFRCLRLPNRKGLPGRGRPGDRCICTTQTELTSLRGYTMSAPWVMVETEENMMIMIRSNMTSNESSRALA